MRPAPRTQVSIAERTLIQRLGGIVPAIIYMHSNAGLQEQSDGNKRAKPRAAQLLWRQTAFSIIDIRIIWWDGSFYQG